jgi:hypothetical protein
LSGRDSQQISRSPNDILVKFVRGAVRIDNFPHHLNELASTIIVQHFVELASKAKEIDCVAIYGDRFFEQAPRRVIIEGELGAQYSVERFTSNLRRFTIHGSNARKQRRGHEEAIVVIGLCSWAWVSS